MRLIDADALKETVHKDFKSLVGVMFSDIAIDSSPTINPEDLTIVKELREKLARYEQAEKEGRLCFLNEPMMPTFRSGDGVYNRCDFTEITEVTGDEL